MKRKDLAVGMAVEVQRGREYRSYHEAIVAAVEPWYERKGFGWRRDTPRFLPTSDGKGNGVAIAIRKDRYGGHSGEAVLVTRWEPDVVSLGALVPVGSRADYEAERKRASEAKEAREQERRNLRDAYAAALGLKPYQVDLDLRGYSVTIPVSTLDNLIAKTSTPSPWKD